MAQKAASPGGILCQMYDEQGRVLTGKGATKDEVYNKGVLHGASHIWIWRDNNGVLEVLLQKRAADKLTWPNCYDISAAGHIDLGETPLEAALRETQEEIGLTLADDKLELFGVHRAHLKAQNGALENELQWLYSLELTGDAAFRLRAEEVASLTWMPITQLKASCTGSQFVSHGQLYFDIVIAALQAAAGRQAS